jgi:hypothetical protein
MKQTAVEWLWEQIDNTIPFQNIQTSQIFNGLLEQAKEMEKEQMIDFASWIGKSEWMSICVVDKWMWESQKENSNTNYKTDKELFDIYYNETYGGNK